MKTFQLSFKKITTFRFPHQETVFWSAGLLLFVFVFTTFMILPLMRRAEFIKGKISIARSRYEKLSEAEGRSHEEILISLRKKLSEVEGNLAHKEKASEVLTSFLKKANEMGINVISVRPESTVPYPNSENPLRLGEKICQALSFQMDIRCSYRTLGTYLEALEKSSPLPFTVDGVEIELKKMGATQSDLKTVLFLTIYLFGNPPS